MRKDISEKKDRILFLISKDISKAYMCREFECQEGTLNNWLKKMNISYNGNQGSKGKSANNKKPASNYLKLNGPFINNTPLKEKLFEEKIKERKCEKCGTIMWNNLEIPLELHHKDGNKHNNLLENLEILCRNCHGQTETFCSKNKKINFQKFFNKMEHVDVKNR